MNCEVCQELADANTLKCNGPCGNSFHISCLTSKNNSYKNALISYMNKIPNLRWFCDNCIKLPMDTQNNITTELSNRLTDIKSFADNLLTMLNPSILTTQIGIGSTTPSLQTGQNDHIANPNGSFTTTASSSEDMDVSPTISSSPQSLDRSSSSSTHSNVNTLPRKRQLTPPSSPQALGPQQKQQKLVSKPALSLADMIAKPKPKTDADPKTTAKTNLIKSMYISPFEPEIEPASIMGLLQSVDDLKYIVPNIVCTKLSGKRKNRSLSFVSFKLDVPRHHFDIVAEYWRTSGKDELTVTEFIDKRETNVHGTEKNPISQPKITQKQKVSHQPSKNKNNNGSGSKRQPTSTEKPKPKPSSVKHQVQRPNFYQHCQKPCCNPPGPQWYHWNDLYAENRYGHRPPYQH